MGGGGGVGWVGGEGWVGGGCMPNLFTAYPLSLLSGGVGWGGGGGGGWGGWGGGLCTTGARMSEWCLMSQAINGTHHLKGIIIRWYFLLCYD